MIRGRTRIFINPNETILQNLCTNFVERIARPRTMFSISSIERPKYTKLPSKRQKSERKPLVVNVNEIKHRARMERQMRQEVQEIILQAPENGLLVEILIPVAHEVYAARNELFNCVSRIVEKIHVHSCRLCGEVHVRPLPHRICTCHVANSLPSKEHVWEKGGVQHVLPLVESFHL